MSETRPFDPTDPDTEKLFNTKQVAEFFEVTPETVRDWIAAKKLAAIRIGSSGAYRVRRSELIRFANANYVGTSGEQPTGE